MSRSIESILNDLENVKSEFISLVTSFSQEQRAQKPIDGWNMLQVMEHIIWSEQGTLEYMKRKTQAPWADIERATDEEHKRSEQLNAALISEKQWKAPDVLPSPTGAQSFDNMLIYWENLRNDYEAFLANLDANYHHRLIFKHPFSGRLSLFQTLDFLNNHVVHHMHQIKRIASAFK
jgi:hypothetical protein